jgi:hypothetical protein
MICMTVWFESWVDYVNVITCDVWEGNVTARRDIYIECIYLLGFFWDVGEGVTLWRVTFTEVRLWYQMVSKFKSRS